MDNYDKALEYNLKGLEIKKQAYRDQLDHPHVASSYNNTGGAYMDMGNYDKALDFGLKALEIYKQAYMGAFI